MDKNRSCCCGALPATKWWLLTLLGLPLLFLLMLGSRQGAVESDLASRSTADLKAAGMDWAQVTLAGRGRDLRIQGTAASEEQRDQAIKLAQSVYGVRVVENHINVAAPAAEVTLPDADTQAQAPVAPAAPEAPVASVASAAPVPPEPSAAPEAPLAPEPPVAQQEPEAPVAPAVPGQAVPEQVAAVEPEAKPEPTAEQQAVQDCQQQLNDAMTGKTILFATDKAAIKQDSLALLDSLAGIVSSCKTVVADRGIQISGHTDNVGNDAYNQSLSQRRAEAVKEYFVGKGIDGGLIKSVGYGEGKPVASNNTPAGRSQNRRISFEISPE
ncbi:MAG: OmpA family protein [Gammaproteobacteria bacterium]|nr:OmpA family protein [Gammaproteobacteria bacterium]